MEPSMRLGGSHVRALALCVGWSLGSGGVAQAQPTCSASDSAPAVVFHDPPCEFVEAPYVDAEARTLPHFWPLPGGATAIAVGAGLGTCHGVMTVRHRRGRMLDGLARAVDVDHGVVSNDELERIGRPGSIEAFTVGGSAEGNASFLQARDVVQMARIGAPQFVVDVALRRSADLGLLRPIADRIEGLRVRIAAQATLVDLPPLACLRSLSVEARSITGISALVSQARLEALEVRGSVSDADVRAIGAIRSLRELRIFPSARAAIEPFREIRQIERLHTRPRPALLEAFAGAPLRRLVLEGQAPLSALPKIAAFRDLRELDVVLSGEAAAHSLASLGSPSQLGTLVLTWPEWPPALPSFPQLDLLIGDGRVDEPLVQWAARQPRLRTVHLSATDEALAPRLRRARVYSISRGHDDGILARPGEPIEADHPHVTAPLAERSALQTRAPSRIDGGRRFRWGNAALSAAPAGGALVVYFRNGWLTGGGYEDPPIVDFVDAARAGRAFAAARQDGRALVRIEGRARDGRQVVRVLLLETDPGNPNAGAVVRNLWVGTAQQYPRLAPEWARMTR